MDKSFTPFPVLITERLTLRQLIFNDNNEILELRSDENVNKYLNRNPATSIEDANNFIKAINENIQKNDSIYWAITLSDTGSFIGTICLFQFTNNKLNAEIGYELLPSFHGKGLMHEAALKVIEFAVQDIGLQSIEAYTHTENKGSTSLLQKLNFKEQGAADDNLMVWKLTTSKSE